jgi:hypothetical protein
LKSVVRVAGLDRDAHHVLLELSDVSETVMFIILSNRTHEFLTIK